MPNYDAALPHWRRSLQPARLGGSALGLAVLLAVGTLLPGCNLNRPTTQEGSSAAYQGSPEPSTPAPPTTTTVPPAGEPTADPEQYMGQTVAISGQVSEVYGSSAFLLQPEPNPNNSEGVLVLVPSPNTVTLPVEGDFVQLTGEVRSFETATLEQDYDFTWDDQLRQALEAQFQSEPIIVAQVK